jgi:predicted DNA-binding transcriptional regulator AlpA
MTAKTEAETDRLWCIQDVAFFLAIPVATLYQWHHRGEGPPVLKLGRHLRYVPQSVRAWAGDQEG